jgi:hypothetical protein
MNGWAAKPINPKQLAASLTNQPVTDGLTLSAGGAQYLRVNISTTVVAGQITYSLQQKINDSWVAVASANASVVVTATGHISLKLNNQIAADQADLPLSNSIRVVGTTNGAWNGTTTSIQVIQEL